MKIKILTPSKEERERFNKEVVHKIIRIDSPNKVGTVYYRTMEEHKIIVDKESFIKKEFKD